jgi:SAM-dependent methyltransferase
MALPSTPTAQELRDFYAGCDWSGTDFAAHYDVLADEILALLGDLPGKRVLDLGCGSAIAGIELAARGFEVTGLDLWVEAARRRMAARNITIRLIEQDMRTMSFGNEFDAVVNWDISGIGVLGTDEQNIDVVRRIHRALVPTGKVLIETYNVDRARLKGIEGLRYDPQENRFKGRMRGYDMSVRLFSLSEWEGIFKSLSFDLIKVCSDMSGKPFCEDSRFLIMVACKQQLNQNPPLCVFNGRQ